MPAPLATNAAGSVFILPPIRRELGKLFDLRIQNGTRKLETGELEVVRQQIGIGVRQSLQNYDGSRSSEVDDGLT
jgi:hypothetical protein